MARLLGSEPDTAAVEEAEPRVIGLGDEETGDLLAALSSETARELLASLHDEPDTPSNVADRVDTTLQNAQYHLGRMEEAGLIEVVDTVYSEKGREMNVYAPADRPLVVFAGGEEERSGLRATLKNLLGAVAGLGVLSALVEYLLRDGPWVELGLAASQGAPTGSAGASESDAAVAAASRSAELAASGATGPPPGLLFFAGGLVVVLGLVAVSRLRNRE